MILVDANVLLRLVQPSHSLHKATRILTLNVNDFKRYEGIEVLDPLVLGIHTGL